MVFERFRLLSILAILSLAGVACSDDGPKGTGQGGSCQVDSDCREGLVCRDLICVGSVTPTDGGNNSADGGNNSADGGPVVTEEDFRVSYKLAAIEGTEKMMILNTATGEEQQVSPEGFNCVSGCWLTEDAGNFLYLRTNTDTPGTFDIYRAPTTTLPVERCDPETDCLVAVATRGIRVFGNYVSYVRAEGTNNVAYYKEVDGGMEIPVGSIGATDSTQGDWHLNPDAQTAIVYQPTLQTLDLLIGEFGQLQESVDFTVDSRNYQEVSGSYFGGSVLTAVNDAGTRMAFVTQRAPLDGDACDDSSTCTNPGARCGRFDRCAFIQVTVHLVDLENAAQLGDDCSSDEACGAVHTCDIPSETQLDQAVCIPRRVVLGLPAEQQQGTPPRAGCEITAGLEDYFFTRVSGPISFGADGDVYFAAQRDCGEGNSPYSAILAVTPEGGSARDILANRDGNFFAEDCFNFDEETATPETCNPYIASVSMGPAGNKLAVVATHPTVSTPSLAPDLTDLWTIERDGTDLTWVGQHNQLESVGSINIHPLP